MTDPKKPGDAKKNSSLHQKVSEEDLEKTVMDVDVRDLENWKEETVIFKRPEPSPTPLPPAPPPPPAPALPPPEKKKLEFKKNLPLFLLNLFFFGLGLDLVFESLKGPLWGFTLPAFLLAGALQFVFIFQKRKWEGGAWASLCIFLALFSYSTARYGAADAKALSLFSYPLSQCFNFIFLGIHLFLLWFFCRPSGIKSLPLRILVALGLLYSSLGFFENLIQGSQIWLLEDTLLGSSWLAGLPHYYLRAPVFAFWFLYPFLILFTLFYFRKTAVIFLLLFTLILSHVILEKNHFPNLSSRWLKSPLGVGQTRILSSNSPDSSHSLTLATATGAEERLSDRILHYYLSGSLNPSGLVTFTLRDLKGHEIFFLKPKDFHLLEQEASQTPKTLRFLEKRALKPKKFGVMIDRSFSAQPRLSFAEKAVQDLHQILNSKESMTLVSFADEAKVDQIKNLSLSAQGNPNLDKAFRKTLPLLSHSSDKIVFLVLFSDTFIPADLMSSWEALFKASQTKLYLLSERQNMSATSLKNLAEKTGGKWFEISEDQELSPALLSAFAEAYGQYQIPYQVQSLAPLWQIVSPSPKTRVSQEQPLTFRISNAQEVKLKVARLWLEDKLLEEIPLSGMAEGSFSLNPAKIPQGSHLFKVTLGAEDGREYSQSIELEVSPELPFQFIRPMEGDGVSGFVNLELYFKSSEQLSINQVDFSVDGEKIGEVTSEPYLYTWQAPSSEGSHVLQAIAHFSDGSTRTEQIKVSVVPGLSLKIVSPSVGEFLSSPIELEAEAVSPLSEAVQKVEFFAEGQSLGEATQAPYKYLWDNSSLSPGRHVIQARLYLANHKTTSDAVIVNIGSGNLLLQMAGENLATSASYLSFDNIEWLIDASKSMNGLLEGVRKIDWVKKSLIEILPKVPESTLVTYRWLGSQSLSSHEDCKDSVLAYPLKAVNVAKIDSLLQNLKAQGLAPLSFAFEKIKTDLKTSSGSRALILITDSNEPCGGDLLAQVDRWKKEKWNAKLYILGLDLAGTRTETALRQLALFSGGQYFPIQHSSQISSTLEQVIKIPYRVLDYKDRVVAEAPVGVPSILRPGEYKVEVNINAPLSRKILISNGVEKKLVLKKEGDKFLLEEQ